MSYQALYRAHRSQKFSEVVGQAHIVKTIQNALKYERLAHAYLFCGPRGTGKTSVAKIIAKTINCDQYPTNEPCNLCSNCVSITKGANADVFEIDAASNNGVDEIREIRDKIKYAPTTGKYKVYIVDEVHMLSTGAFNALLKTLEEPPGHAIFILATTESHKIPATIISRCQRFDFKQITAPAITVHLKEVLNKQKIAYEEEAISLIATLAEGGMRDALSMLDQVISYTDDLVKQEDVHTLSGTVHTEQLLEIMEAIDQANFAKMIEKTQNLIQNGKEPARILDGLITVCRDLLTFKKIELAPESLVTNDVFIKLAADFSAEQIVHSLYTLNQLQQELKFSNHPALMLEVGLIGLKKQESSASEILELKNELEALKHQVQQLAMGSLKVNKQEAIILPEEVASGTLAIEEILNEASKAAKDLVMEKWSQLSPYTMPEYKEVVTLMLEGQVAAASDKGFILTYRHAPACKRLLREENRQIALRLVAYLFARPYAFTAMPESFWLEARQDYLQQKQKGISPQLKQYSQNVKNVINYNEEEQTKAKDFVDDMIDMYGDLVNVKE